MWKLHEELFTPHLPPRAPHPSGGPLPPLRPKQMLPSAPFLEEPMHTGTEPQADPKAKLAAEPVVSDEIHTWCMQVAGSKADAVQ